MSVTVDNGAKHHVAYNVYRELLGSYNDEANRIIEAMPAERVRQDQGISKQLESMM